MKVKINHEKGIISFNNKEVKIQPIYFRKYENKEKLNKDIKRQLMFTQKKNKEASEKHYFNALQLFYSNSIKDISIENIEIINWLEPTYVPKMTTYNQIIDYESKILKRQEDLGFYDI